MQLKQVLTLREKFIQGCSQRTRIIHSPIQDLEETNGTLNPKGLGNAYRYSMNFVEKFGWGQSTVGFHRVEDFKAADKNGRAYNGLAEYGIVRSAAVAQVCEKIASLQGAKDAVLFSSGILAITNVLQSLPSDEIVLVPENCYFPTTRAMDEKLNQNYVKYPSNASPKHVKEIIERLKSEEKKVGAIYMEAPGSQTYEIPDIDGLVALAKELGLKTIMDNTWANHIGFRPLEHGIDIGIEAGTKYQGGYGDTPSGYIYSNDVDFLARTARVLGTGSVDAATCGRLYHRLDSTKRRMSYQHNSALKAITWFKQQSFVSDVIAPFDIASPDYARFNEYFDQANGLFTVVFNQSAADVQAFLDASPLIIKGESWGGHVLLASMCDPKRTMTKIPDGVKVRFSMGLEKPEDAIRSLEVAAPILERAL